MLHFGASKLAVFAAVCLLGIGADRLAHAQAYTVTNLGGYPEARSTSPRASTTPARWWDVVWSAVAVTLRSGAGGQWLRRQLVRHGVERGVGDQPRRVARKPK
jgi:hypothetical protein